MIPTYIAVVAIILASTNYIPVPASFRVRGIDIAHPFLNVMLRKVRYGGRVKRWDKMARKWCWCADKRFLHGHQQPPAATSSAIYFQGNGQEAGYNCVILESMV